jgi:hypothetical protein
MTHLFEFPKMRGFSLDCRQKAALHVGDKSQKSTFATFGRPKCNKFVSFVPNLLRFFDNCLQQIDIEGNIGHI